MADENTTPEQHDEDGSEITEIVSEFEGDIRLRSGFRITEHGEPGALGFTLHGPLFEVDDEEDEQEPDDAKDAEL